MAAGGQTPPQLRESRSVGRHSRGAHSPLPSTHLRHRVRSLSSSPSRPRRRSPAHPSSQHHLHTAADDSGCKGLVASTDVKITVYDYSLDNASRLLEPRNCFAALCNTGDPESSLQQTKYEYLHGAKQSDFIVIAHDEKDNGSIAGFAFVKIAGDKGLKHRGTRVMYVGLICARRKSKNATSPAGVGTMLMTSIEHLALAHGCTALDLFSENDTSDEFYISRGFKHKKGKHMRKRLIPITS